MKKMWNENRVMFLLIMILLVCFVAILTVALTFFYTKNVSKYGNRLDGIEKHPISAKVKKSYQDSLLENESVDKVKFNVEGRIIYVNVKYKEGMNVDEAKAQIEASLELFPKKITSYYDVEFVLTSGDFSIIGAKNSVSDHVSWNNNRPVEQEKEK